MAKKHLKHNLSSTIGQNIRFLRRKAGLTIRELAEAIGIQPTPLGNIERGVNAPSARVIASLTKVLGVSTDTIFAENPHKRREAHERSKVLPFPVLPESRAISAPVLEMGERLCNACLALEDLCGAQKHAEVPLRVHLAASVTGMADLAHKIRQYMNIQSGIVLDYFELFETCGFRVFILPLEKPTESFSFFDPANENAFFFINADMNGERQLFQLAFELGLVSLRSSQMLTAQSPEQLSHLARKFAAFFIMPAESVLKTVGQLGLRNNAWTYDLLLRIKHRFGISAESFLYRLRELEKIEEATYRKLKKQIYTHYQASDYSEPDSTRRIMTPNGRLWDLVAVARGKYPGDAEVNALEQELKKMNIPVRAKYPRSTEMNPTC